MALPFETYTVPSMILGFAVAGTSAAAAVTAWRGKRAAGSAGGLAGAFLSGWIAAQVGIIGASSFSSP